MKILIGADMVPTKTTEQAFYNGEIEKLFDQELINIIMEADYRIFNLEVPLASRETPIMKCGPCLIAKPDAIAAFKRLKIDLFALANNHIMDQGVQGLNETLATLRDANISFVGVGSSIDEASSPYIITNKDLKVGIYNCAEHEFSIADQEKPGANPFDPLFSLDHIERLGKECDYVIVLYHGGKEEYRFPSPLLQKTCRRIIDKGADLVICQHTHCVGCEEKWNSGIIVYGQGNAQFDRNYSECWDTSLFIKVDCSKDKFCVQYIPMYKKNACMYKPDHNHEKEIMDAFFYRGAKIKDPRFVKENYSQYSSNHISQYYMRILGKIGGNIFFRALNKISGNRLIRNCFASREILAVINTLECEPHRELFLEALRKEIQNYSER